jgi:hypothetical protein
LTGTCGEKLATLGPPSEWIWPGINDSVWINDSRSRQNFSASMARPRGDVSSGFVATTPIEFNQFREIAD